jgi:hypothetical protein
VNYEMDHMWHRAFLASLACRIRPTCFLELGVHRDPALVNVAQFCDLVVGVDRDLYLVQWPENSKFYQMTTDAFFAWPAAEIPPPELVFVDADHRREQVIKDLYGVEAICAENCIVVIHDTFPPGIEFTTDVDCSNSYLVPPLLPWEHVTLPVPPGVTLCRMKPRSLV